MRVHTEPLCLLAMVWAVGCGAQSETAQPAPATSTGGAIGTTSSTPSSSANPGVDLNLPPADPASQGQCRAGHYSGAFNGRYTSGATLIGIPIDVTGDVDLRLNQESLDREFFAIQDGHVKGTADKSFPYDCVMTGTLDCVSKQLQKGFIACTYHVLVMSYTFSGPVTAEFDPVSETLENGTWSGKEPNMLAGMGGSGTWNATWDAP